MDQLIAPQCLSQHQPEESMKEKKKKKTHNGVIPIIVIPSRMKCKHTEQKELLLLQRDAALQVQCSTSKLAAAQ